MKRWISVVFAAMGLIGCASVPMGDAKLDAKLKMFPVPGDKAGLYVYRNESMGAAITMDVEIDGRPIGQTAANTYLYKEVAPGKHTVISKAENTDYLEIEAKLGTLNYVWQEVKMGALMARTKLHLVNEEEGRQGVLETNLAETK